MCWASSQDYSRTCTCICAWELAATEDLQPTIPCWASSVNCNFRLSNSIFVQTYNLLLSQWSWLFVSTYACTAFTCTIYIFIYIYIYTLLLSLFSIAVFSLCLLLSRMLVCYTPRSVQTTHFHLKIAALRLVLRTVLYYLSRVPVFWIVTR